MGLWKKSPRADPTLIAQLQARVDADPLTQRFSAGYGSPDDPWRREQGGRGSNPNHLRDRVRQLVGRDLPDGYDVSQDGQIVYTNQTPFLQQAAYAALPFVGAYGAQSLAGAFGPAAAGVTTAAAPTTAATTGAGFMGLSPSGWLNAAIFGGQLFGDIWSTNQQVGVSDRAAEAQLQANREALAFLEKQWNVAREDFAPYLKLGHASAGRLNDYVTTTPTPTMPANLRQFAAGGYDPQTYTPRPNWTPAGGAGASAGGAAQRPATLGGSFGRPSDVIDLSRTPEGVFTAQPVPLGGAENERRRL